VRYVRAFFRKFPSLTIGAIGSAIVAAAQIWQGSPDWTIAVPQIAAVVIHLFVTPAEKVGL
jgi:hypothetical protein